MATLSPLLASLTLQGQPRCSAASSSRVSLRGSSVRASACVRAGRPRTGLCALAAQEAAETEPEAAPRGARGKRDSGPPAKRGPRGAPREKSEFEERVVQVARVTKVTKGGKMLAFRAVVVVGNKAGKVGVGVAKAKEVIDERELAKKMRSEADAQDRAKAAYRAPKDLRVGKPRDTSNF